MKNNTDYLNSIIRKNELLKNDATEKEKNNSNIEKLKFY